MAGKNTRCQYVFVVGTILLFTILSFLHDANRYVVDAAQNTPENASFKEIAQIECTTKANTPPSYSQPPNIQVNQVRWNPKKDFIAIWCSNTPDIYIFDSVVHEQKYTLVDPYPDGDEFGAELSWSPDGNFLLKATKRDIDVWQLTDSSMDYFKHIKRVSDFPSIAWHPDSQYFADVEGTDINNQRKVVVYTMPSGKIVDSFIGKPNALQYVLWSKDGSKLIATTWEDEIQIWDANTYKLIDKVSLPTGGTIVRGLNNNVIGSYCSSTEGLCTLWALNIDSLKWQEPFDNKVPIRNFFTYKVFQTNPDGDLLASHGGREILYVFDTSIGKTYAQINLHSDYATSVSWNTDGRSIAVGETDGSVYIWTLS